MIKLLQKAAWSVASRQRISETSKLASHAQGRTTKRENRTQESVEEYHVTSLKSGKASLYISNFILMIS